jgi:hypothetical protein
MDAPTDDREVHIAKQLPVITPQWDSLAVVMFTRWMRLVAAYGSARLEVRYRHGQEFWCCAGAPPPIVSTGSRPQP